MYVRRYSAPQSVPGRPEPETAPSAPSPVPAASPPVQETDTAIPPGTEKHAGGTTAPAFGRILYILQPETKKEPPAHASCADCPYKKAAEQARRPGQRQPPPRAGGSPLQCLTDKLGSLFGKGDVEWLPLALAAAIWLLSRDKEGNNDLPLILALLLIAL